MSLFRPATSLPMRLTGLNPHRMASIAAFASASSNSAENIRKVVVYGSGLMGAGIVQVTAQSNIPVTMIDVKQDQLTRGLSLITASLERITRKSLPNATNAERKSAISHTLSLITPTTSTSPTATAAVAESDLVVEAIIEDLPTKQALFASLDEIAPRSAIFASNTSSLPVSDIASAVSAGRQVRFAGLHFFNPVPQMKLVEVVAVGGVTEGGVVSELKAFAKRLGKVPVECKDTPGFIVNRLLVPYMLEALRLVERGDATKEDVDVAMKLGAGYPMGPFELMDYVGLDTMKFITDGWYKAGKGLQGQPLVEPCPTLETLTSQGKLGRKSGEGFYSYKK